MEESRSTNTIRNTKIDIGAATAYGHSVLDTIKKWMDIILFLAVTLEIILFPSWYTLSGCIMTCICWLIFKPFFRREIILHHPFSFMMFFSMFLYRYIPLIATLIEGKPITYGFALPLETFLFETILFFVSAVAFYFGCKTIFSQNNFIQRFFHSLGFFSNNPVFIWYLGIVGMTANLYLFFTNQVEYGDIFGKFCIGISYLSYAPLCLLFPSLLRLNAYSHNREIWIYVIFLFILNISTNSRYAILSPIALLTLLYILSILQKNTPARLILFSKKNFIIVCSLILSLFLLSRLSDAMLETRSIRHEVSKKELFRSTVKSLVQSKINSAHRPSSRLTIQQLDYTSGWDETYLDNFLLNRYGNMRITDQTLYYAYNAGFANKNMRHSFYQSIVALLPTPVLSFFNISLNKEDLEYSRGDLLYSLGSHNTIIPSYRVTSHLGDGLATFGFWYFPIQFILFFLVFKLLDSFVFYSKSGIIYSVLGLMNIFLFLSMFRNAGGCLQEVAYCLRGFWQECFIFALFVCIFRLITIRPYH